MAKVKRNGPCPCGSGNKAKRCCYGTQEPVHDGMLPREVGDAAIEDLNGTDEIELRAYFDGLLDLSELDCPCRYACRASSPRTWTAPSTHSETTTMTASTRRSTRCSMPSIRPSDASLSPKQSSDSVTRARSRGSSRPWPSSNSTAPSRSFSLLGGRITGRSRRRAAHARWVIPRRGLEPELGILAAGSTAYWRALLACN